MAHTDDIVGPAMRRPAVLTFGFAFWVQTPAVAIFLFRCVSSALYGEPWPGPYALINLSVMVAIWCVVRHTRKKDRLLKVATRLHAGDPSAFVYMEKGKIVVEHAVER